jgi:ribosomal protein L28
MKCDNCEKSGQFGHRVSHSQRHTVHRFVANIQSAKVEEGGKMVRHNLCTRCLRTFRKIAQAAST